MSKIELSNSTFLDKSSLLKYSAVVFLYSWSFYSRTTYTAFFMGMLSTILAEVFLIWNYLASKIQKESGQKINLSLATLELRRIFGGDVGVNYRDVQRKIAKKKYYQNSKSKPLMTFSDYNRKGDNQSTYPPVSYGKSGSFVQSIDHNISEFRPTFSHKPINELLKMKERSEEKQKLRRQQSPSKTDLEERATMIKVGHKNFTGQLEEYLKVLECLSVSEKVYGKAMYGMNGKQEGMFKALEDNYLERDDKRTSTCEIGTLSQEDLSFLKKKFGDHIQHKRMLILPDWKSLKESLSLIGKIHFNCSVFVSSVSVATIDMMSLEYNEKYAEVKEEKKQIAEAYEEAYLAYFKIKSEYETLYKALDVALADYQAKYKKKEADEVVLRSEMKARLLKSQLDSLKNKMVGTTDSLKDMIKKVYLENDKLRNFIKDWKLRQASVCQNVLRGVISILEESFVDCEASLERLLGNTEDLYCSFQNLDDAEDRDNSLFEEKNDALSKIYQRGSVHEKRLHSPKHLGNLEERNEFAVRENRMSLPSSDPNKITPAELEIMFKQFKSMIKEYNQVYEKETKKYDEEVKKSKEVLNILTHLSEYIDEYVKEQTKIVSYNSLNIEIPNFTVYWTIVQENFKLVSHYTVQLHEKLLNIDRMYAEGIRNCKKEFKNSEIIVTNAVKRATNFAKDLEREVAAKSFAHLIKQWFNKSPEPSSQGTRSRVSTIDRIFGSESMSGIYNRDEDLIGCEKEYLKNDFKIGLTQIKNATKSFQKEAATLKKDVILAYLQCYTNQKELLFALVKEIDKISHFTENIESRLQEIYNQSDDENDDQFEQQPPEMKPLVDYRRDSLITPIKIEKVPDIDLETPKMTGGHDDEDSPALLQEIHTKAGELVWINKMLKVFFLEWSRSAYFKEKIMKVLYTGFNKKKAKLIRQIKVLDFILGDKAPDLRSITYLPSDSIEFLCDFELVLQSSVSFEIQVQFESQPILNMLNKDKPLFIDAKIIIKSLTGKIRICWVPTEYGTSWFSFVGEPLIDLNIEPKIGKSQFDLSGIPQVIAILRDFLDSRIRKMTYPYRKELDLPMAFRGVKVLPLNEDNDYQ